MFVSRNCDEVEEGWMDAFRISWFWFFGYYWVYEGFCKNVGNSREAFVEIGIQCMEWNCVNKRNGNE